MDQVFIERNGITITDVFADVGGLQSFLISGIQILLYILNYDQLNSYLVSKLFKS